MSSIKQGEDALDRAVNIILPMLAICACVVMVVHGCNQRAEQPAAKPKYTLDNYSFSVGVHCAYQAYKNGWVQLPKEFDNDATYAKLLHAARHEAMTNGWPEFNGRDGFVGDEIAKP